MEAHPSPAPQPRLHPARQRWQHVGAAGRPPAGDGKTCHWRARDPHGRWIERNLEIGRLYHTDESMRQICYTADPSSCFVERSGHERRWTGMQQAAANLGLGLEDLGHAARKTAEVAEAVASGKVELATPVQEAALAAEQSVEQCGREGLQCVKKVFHRVLTESKEEIDKIEKWWDEPRQQKINEAMRSAPAAGATAVVNAAVGGVGGTIGGAIEQKVEQAADKQIAKVTEKKIAKAAADKAEEAAQAVAARKAKEAAAQQVAKQAEQRTEQVAGQAAVHHAAPGAVHAGEGAAVHEVPATVPHPPTSVPGQGVAQHQAPATAPKRPPRNPHGSPGNPDHQAKVDELKIRARQEFPSDRYVIKSNQDLPEKPKGLRRRPDVAVVDNAPPKPKTVKAYEAVRTDPSGRPVWRERKKQADYAKHGIPVENHPVR